MNKWICIIMVVNDLKPKDSYKLFANAKLYNDEKPNWYRRLGNFFHTWPMIGEKRELLTVESLDRWMRLEQFIDVTQKAKNEKDPLAMTAACDEYFEIVYDKDELYPRIRYLWGTR